MSLSTRKTALAAAAAFGLLALAACGGGGGGGNNSQPPMSEAIESNDTEAITRLVEAGQDVDGVYVWSTADSHPLTPLHLAAGRRKHDALSALLKADPDANVDARTWRQDQDHSLGRTPMYYAFRNISASVKDDIDIAVIRILLEAGADPNFHAYVYVKSKGGLRRYWMSPLAMAAERENMAAIAALLEAGADPSAKSTRRYKDAVVYTTAISYTSNTTIIAALLEAGAEPAAGDFLSASEQSKTAVFAALLEAGADPNVKDEEGYTALHMAARDGNTAAIAALLEAGADPNEREIIGGNTPLHMVRSENRAAMIALIEGGADPNLRNNEGALPSASAAHLQRVHEGEERAAEAKAERERLEAEAEQRRHEEEMRRIQAETAAARQRAADETRRALESSQRTMYNTWCLANPSQCTTYQVITP